MSAILGLVEADAGPVSKEFQTLTGAMSGWGPDRVLTWVGPGAALGQCLLHDTPESIYETSPAATASDRVVFAVEARLDNRDELCDHLDIAASARSTTADGTIVRRAYERWGEDCPSRLYGDWSFAAWHPQRRRLFVARDHFGQTALYYTWNGHRFAFASDMSALLALPSVSPRLNEYRLALRLVIAPGEPSTETVYADIHRLIPAHTLTFDRGEVRTAAYWTLADAPPVRLGGLDQYAEGLREHVERSVRSCLRGTGPFGLTLSGGMDSGTVATVAAPALARRNENLTALTSVPLYDTSPFVGTRVGDEFPRASAAIRGWGNVTHLRVDAKSTSPVRGAMRILELHREPTVAVMNHYWIVALLEAAQQSGTRVLLTGQQGNGAMSWDGMPSFWSMVAAVRAASISLARREALDLARLWCIHPLRRRMTAFQATRSGLTAWHKYSALNPAVATRVRLLERMRDERIDRSFLFRIKDGPTFRAWIMRPTSQHAGTRWARLAAAHGMVTRDPTADVRLMMFAHRIPEHLWRGPLGRWVLRRAMQGAMPDEVRLARETGRQSGDLVLRLRASADEVWSAIAAVTASPLSREFLDCDRLKPLAERLLQGDMANPTNALTVDATVLMRGIGHGLFLASLD